jgi:hypothetical protein
MISTSTLIHQAVEKKGTFQLTGDLLRIQEEVKDIPSEFAECTDAGEFDEESGELINFDMTPEQSADMAEFNRFFVPEFDWTETFKNIPRKANGTFAKNRVLVLAQGHAFSWESEEEYGRRGPELRIKTYSDTQAQLEFHSTIIDKY